MLRSQRRNWVPKSISPIHIERPNFKRSAKSLGKKRGRSDNDSRYSKKNKNRPYSGNFMGRNFHDMLCKLCYHLCLNNDVVIFVSIIMLSSSRLHSFSELQKNPYFLISPTEKLSVILLSLGGEIFII